MVIYGVTLLAACMLGGVFLGKLLGMMLGIDANLGGIGFAMIFLILAVDYLQKKNKLEVKSQEGLLFWSAMYIPIIIAMSASQNVIAAVKGGPMALAAGLGAVAVSFALVPVLSKLGKQDDEELEDIKKDDDNEMVLSERGAK